MLTVVCLVFGVGLLGVGLFRLGHRQREDRVSSRWLEEREYEAGKAKQR